MNETNATWSKLISTLLDEKRTGKESPFALRETVGKTFGFVSLKAKRDWAFNKVEAWKCNGTSNRRLPNMPISKADYYKPKVGTGTVKPAKEVGGKHLSEANSGTVATTFYERNGRRRGLRPRAFA
jgi:hypothetical protein